MFKFTYSVLLAVTPFALLACKQEGNQFQVVQPQEVVTGRTLEQTVPACRALVEKAGALYTAVTTNPKVKAASEKLGIPIMVQGAETVRVWLDITATYPESEWASRCEDDWVSLKRETANSIQILTGGTVSISE